MKAGDQVRVILLSGRSLRGTIASIERGVLNGVGKRCDMALVVYSDGGDLCAKLEITNWRLRVLSAVDLLGELAS